MREETMKNKWYDIKISDEDINRFVSLAESFKALTEESLDPVRIRPAELAKQLEDSFTWMNTPQGFRYWREVANNLNNLEMSLCKKFEWYNPRKVGVALELIKRVEIPVPDSIQFVKAGEGDGLGMGFNEDRVLFTVDNKVCINNYKYFFQVKTKLLKVNKPEAGNWYFVSNEDKPDFTEKEYYHKYISKEKYISIKENRNISEGKIGFYNYWQVVRCEQ